MVDTFNNILNVEKMNEDTRMNMLHTDLLKIVELYTDNQGIVYNRVMNAALNASEVTNMSLSAVETTIEKEVNTATLVETLKWFAAFATSVYRAESVDIYNHTNLIVIEAHFANNEFKEHIVYED